MTCGGLYRVGPRVVGVLILALLAGCGRSPFQQREAWRGQAELQCLRSGSVKKNPYLDITGSISGPGICGMDAPIKVSAFSEGHVALNGRSTLACPMVAATERWLREIVQPAAQRIYGAAVIDMRVGSYACRTRNNQAGARLSEHSFGNALDVFGFRFANGHEVKVVSGWRGQPYEQDFLREVFVRSCGLFSTVLGPGADMFHYDHFHFDLARHASGRSYCRPIIKYDPGQPGPVAQQDRNPLLSMRSSQRPNTAVDMEPDEYEGDQAPAEPPAQPTRQPARNTTWWNPFGLF
jgi:hypothetical protein